MSVKPIESFFGCSELFYDYLLLKLLNCVLFFCDFSNRLGVAGTVLEIPLSLFH